MFFEKKKSEEEYIKEGEEYYKAAKYYAAVECFNHAIKINRCAATYVDLGNSYFELHQTDSCVENFSKAIELESENPYPYKKIGIIKYHQSDLIAAGEYFDKALTLDKEDTEAIFFKGGISEKKGNYYDTIKYADSILNLEEHNKGEIYWQGWFFKGELLAKLNKNHEAKELFEKYMERFPKSEEGLSNLALACRKLKEYERAISLYDKLIELDTNDYSSYISKSGVLIEMKKYGEALEYINKSIKIDSKQIDSYLARIYLYYEEKDFEKVTEQAYKVIEMKPENYATYSCLGLIFIDMGRYEEAEDMFDRLIFIDRDCITRMTYRADYYRYISLKKANKNVNKIIMEALKLLKSKLVDLKLIDDYYLYRLILVDTGFFLGEIKQYDEAIWYYNKAIESNSYEAESYFMRAKFYVKVNEKAKAVEDIKKVLQLDEGYEENIKKDEYLRELM